MQLKQCGILSINDVDKAIYIDMETRELIVDTTDGLIYLSNVIMPDHIEEEDNEDESNEYPSPMEVQILKNAYKLDGLAIVGGKSVAINLGEKKVTIGDIMLQPKYDVELVLETPFEGDISNVQI